MRGNASLFATPTSSSRFTRRASTAWRRCSTIAIVHTRTVEQLGAIFVLFSRRAAITFFSDYLSQASH